MSPVVYNIYKHVLRKDGTVADIREFIDVWWNEDFCKNLPVGTKWSEVFNLWPEFATAVFLRKYLNDQ
jgi:hypothetical protein